MTSEAIKYDRTQSEPVSTQVASTEHDENRPKPVRIIMLLVLYSVGGGLAFFLVSYFNAGLRWDNAKYHLTWTIPGLFAGLAFATTALIVCWRDYGKRGGALTGLFVGAITTPVAIWITALLTSHDASLFDVPNFAVFIGALVFARIGMKFAE